MFGAVRVVAFTGRQHGGDIIKENLAYLANLANI